MNKGSKTYLPLIVIAFTAFSFQSYAQDCTQTVNKAAAKNYKKALLINSVEKKEVKKKRGLLVTALENDANLYGALWELTSLDMDNPYLSEITVKEVKNNLLKVIENCPSLHSSPYFILGEIYKGENNYDMALKYYNEFLNFKEKSREKYDLSRYNRYKKEANEGIEEINMKLKAKK